MNRVLLDCDTHFSDHEEALWSADDLTTRTRPEIVTQGEATRLRLGDRLFPKPQGLGQGNPRGLGHLIGPGHDADREKFMEENHIAAAVLQPGFVGLSLQAVIDERERTSLAADYNTLAARSCARSAVNLKWAVLLSAEDPQWSADAIDRHLGDEHLVGAVIRPTARTREARLNDPAFTPVLEKLAAASLPLMVHGGTGCYQWSPLADGYSDYTMTHVFGHMGEQMVALADLLTRDDGLPAGFSGILLESGTSWIPSFLDRLDSHLRRLSDRGLTPSQVFRRHFAVVPDPEEKYALWACQEIGSGNVLFGSDYPHWDTVHTQAWMETFAKLCPPEMLLENTTRFAPLLAKSGIGA